MIGVSQMRNLQGNAYAFEIQQQVPLSSKLTDDKRTREHKFDLQKKESSYFSDSVLLEARLAFVNYWASYEKLKLMEELQKWLKHHLEYSQSLARSDTEMRVYALEIESSIGIYDNEINNIKNSLESEKVKLRRFVFDSSYEPNIPIFGDPSGFSESSGSSRISELDLSRLRVATSDFEVAKSANLPNLFMKVRKLDRPMLGMANQEVMVGIDLPFAFFWQARAEEAEASASKIVAQARYQKSLVESEAFKKSLKAQADLTKMQLQNLDRISIPAADKRLRLLKNISPRDMSGLNSHYKVFQDAIELKSQRVDVRYRYEELYTKWMILFGEPQYAQK
jgi:outer membrane protein TolC